MFLHLTPPLFPPPSPPRPFFTPFFNPFFKKKKKLTTKSYFLLLANEHLVISRDFDPDSTIFKKRERYIYIYISIYAFDEKGNSAFMLSPMVSGRWFLWPPSTSTYAGLLQRLPSSTSFFWGFISPYCPKHGFLSLPPDSRIIPRLWMVSRISDQNPSEGKFGPRLEPINDFCIL